MDSYQVNASYGQNSTTATIAHLLFTGLSASGSPVTATLNGTTISMVAKATGSSTNYTVTSSTAYDTTDFSSPSFSVDPDTFQGGTDANTPSDPNLQHPFKAIYTYDPLDELTKVSQGAQTRSYVYNGLQQLASATTPEAGTVSYTYTSFGDIATRTDARGVVTTYGYDTLNRPDQISYNVGSTGVPATATVTYGYDAGGAAANALGRMTSMTDGVGSETYTYNALGQMTQLAKVISGTTYTMKYAYNLGGELTSITYPSGRGAAAI